MVEVIVVIMILLIVMAMAIVQVRALLPAMRANAAMNLVVGQMRTAREMAIAQRRSVQVVFTQPNQIRLTRVNQPVGVFNLPAVFFEGGAQFGVFPGIPDTPSAFGNSAPIVFGGMTGGPPNMQFQSNGTFADGLGQPLNGTVFIGIPGQPATARAVTTLGATGRVRPYRWTGSVWAE
jgi:hypothetical protein